MMKTVEYVSKDEVRLVCRELGLRDWTALADGAVSAEEAAVILKAINTQGMEIPLAQFQKGLAVELEHGTLFDDANVTNNHPLLTGMIVLAHLKESMDYYMRLDVVEIEGDLLKAIQDGDLAKVEAKYKKMLVAQIALNQLLLDHLA